ncbi:XRE family transcriptional regulator [Pseudomonas sp. ADAK2]|uniref:XRE family transcriptional regulator n=1 Tax=Pseudomonas TaxID=286 RepID=UPI001463CC05|nr:MULTISPECIES: XRE family transcriptional regulator [unclassified Pseudomonas]QJI44716.1 XRE family transcriptional regulator [Pseudomonas sp. ADAK7]QJI51017.1 XRE family transcriptional regulator [Pseudomonas sp. ADAK2]
MSDIDAGVARGKAEYVMRIGMLLDNGDLSKTEAAQKLGLSEEELDEMLQGRLDDLTVTKILDHLDLLKGETQRL